MKGGELRFDQKTGMWDPGNSSADPEVYQYSVDEADALNLLKVPNMHNPIAFLMQNGFDLRGVHPEPLGQALEKLCNAYALRVGVDKRKGDGGHVHYRERLGNLINMIILNTSEHRQTSHFRKAMANFEHTTNEVASYKRAAEAAEAKSLAAEKAIADHLAALQKNKSEAIGELKKNIGIQVIERAYEDAIAHKIAENTRSRIHRRVQIVYFVEIVPFLPKKWEQQVDWWVIDVLLNPTQARDRLSVTMSDIRNATGGSRTRRRRRIRKSRRIK
jgi:hypothetical protein